MRHKLLLIPAAAIASQLPLASCLADNETKNVVALIMNIPEHATIDQGLKTIIINKGSKWSDIQLPTIEYDYGYAADYWDDNDGNIIDANTVFNKTTYINLHVKSLSKVTVTFQPDDKGYGSLDYTSIEVWEGAKWADVEKPFVFLTEAGQTAKQRFSKWVDTNGNDIPDTTIITSNFTAKAKFEKTKAINITFKSGEHGSFDGGATSIDVETIESARWWAISKPFIEEDIDYDFDKWIYEDTQDPVSANDQFNSNRTIVATYKDCVKQSFENTSWKNIGKFAREYEKGAITAKQLCERFTDVEYNSSGATESEKLQNFVGKTHIVHLDSITHHARIIGAATDTIDNASLTNPKAAFSFEFIENATIKVDTIAQSYKMFNSESQTYSGSKYSNSNLWNNVLPVNCFKKLDTDLQMIIKPVVKYCLQITLVAGGGSVTWEKVRLGSSEFAEREKIWLLGVANIYSTNAITGSSWGQQQKDAYIAEQDTIGQYQYYKNEIGDSSIDSDVAKQVLTKYDVDSTTKNGRWLTTQGCAVASGSKYPGYISIASDFSLAPATTVTSQLKFCPCFSI